MYFYRMSLLYIFSCLRRCMPINYRLCFEHLHMKDVDIVELLGASQVSVRPEARNKS